MKNDNIHLKTDRIRLLIGMWKIIKPPKEYQSRLSTKHTQKYKGTREYKCIHYKYEVSYNTIFAL